MKSVAKRKYNLLLTEQEMVDLLSAMTMAVSVAEAEHQDSPIFRKALDRLVNKIWKIKRLREVPK